MQPRDDLALDRDLTVPATSEIPTQRSDLADSAPNDSSPADVTQALEPEQAKTEEGMMLGQYRLLSLLGSGGMGQVFKAVHRTMDRVVALKVMAPQLVQDSRARARFLREVRSAAKLSHPNIVLAHDADEDAGRCFLAMEYIEGSNLGTLVREHGLPPVSLACEMIRQTALGLQHAFEHGMAHRDIKPGNLMLTSKVLPRSSTPPVQSGRVSVGWSAEPLVKILDFGLVRQVIDNNEDREDPASASTLTREGSIIGTPEFMAPEQALDSRNADIRADIYSLGCTFYFLLTGRPPFVGRSHLETVLQHQQEKLPPLSSKRRDLPEGLAAIVERMMAKNPADRYQTPKEVANALRPWAAGGPWARPSSEPVRSEQPATEPLELPRQWNAASTAPPATSKPVPSYQPPPPQSSRSFISVLILIFLSIVAAGLIWIAYRNSKYSEFSTDDIPSDELRYLKTIDLAMARLPAGPFALATAARNVSVRLNRDFETAATEVTRRHFQQFVEAAGYRTLAESDRDTNRGSLVYSKGIWQQQADASWRNCSQEDDPNLPVLCVAWEDAISFCNWLSEQEGCKPCYRRKAGSQSPWMCDFWADGFRLPTDAEWEYAARAGQTQLLPGSASLLPAWGWFSDNSNAKPHPVSAKKANARQLYDVWGNVWEWCWDWHADRGPIGPLVDPTGPEQGSKHIVRGGSWAEPASYMVTNFARKSYSPEHRSTDVGFRVVRTLPPRK